MSFQQHQFQHQAHLEPATACMQQLGWEFQNKMAVSPSDPKMEAQAGCTDSNASQNVQAHAGFSGGIDQVQQLQRSQVPGTAANAEQPCSFQGFPAHDVTSVPMQEASMDLSMAVEHSDEFDDELCYLADQVQLEDSVSCRGQSMPYIF